MKSRTLKFAVGIVLLAELATPFLLAAQKPRYKLIDLGTFCGPNSYFTFIGARSLMVSTSRSISSNAVLAHFYD